MITAVLLEDGDQLRLAVDGHAGAGPEGHDLVCAAVSTITTALANLVADGGETALDKGHARISAAITDRNKAYFAFADEALALLAETAPDNITYRCPESIRL